MVFVEAQPDTTTGLVVVTIRQLMLLPAVTTLDFSFMHHEGVAGSGGLGEGGVEIRSN